jgi:hypothetical protein
MDYVAVSISVVASALAGPGDRKTCGAIDRDDPDQHQGTHPGVHAAAEEAKSMISSGEPARVPGIRERERADRIAAVNGIAGCPSSVDVLTFAIAAMIEPAAMARRALKKAWSSVGVAPNSCRRRRRT